MNFNDFLNETEEKQDAPEYSGKHPKELKKIMDAAGGFSPNGAMIAGGALTSVFTNLEIHDVDMYFKSKADFIAAIESAYDWNMWCLAATDRAVTFAKNDKIIQLMHFDYFDNAEAVFDAFDFTVCMAAFDLDKQEFVFHEDFLKHAAQRFLRFHNGTRFPFGSLLRVLKYQQRGYNIGKSDLLRIALCCHEIQLNSWDELAKAIGGQYGEKVNIDDSKPFSIDAALEIFGSSEVMVVSSPGEMPGNAEDLLIKLGMVEGGSAPPVAPAPPAPVVHAWWVKFENGTAACIEAIDKEDGVKLAEAITEAKVSGIEYLPYPAEPRLNKHVHPDLGVTPSFCFSPTKCAGNTCCNQRYACTE